MKIIRSLPAQRKLPFQVNLSLNANSSFQNQSPLRARDFFRLAASCLLTLQLSFAPILSARPGENPSATKAAAAKAGDPILKVMQAELSRATTSLSKSDPAPYFVSYTVNDQDIVVLVGSYGSLLTDAAIQRRQADVVMRVGSAALDNTHGQSRASGMTSGTLPLGNDPDAISRVLWELTDREYKRAAPAYLNVKTNTAVRAEEEDKSPDFSNEAPQKHTGEALKPQAFDRTAWEGELRRLSGAFRKYPGVYFASVILQAQDSKSRLVSSEGTAIASPSAITRLVMEAQTRSDDGMDLIRVETFQAPSAAGLPSEADLSAKIDKMAADLKDLRKAPAAEPYDDPTIHELAGMKLAGSYDYDNEGSPAQRVEVIQNGILKNFLMSRMPIKNFGLSNGHGRNQPGLMPTGRQGNLIVTSTQTVPEAQLRQKLIDEVKRQGKPYGLYFDDIQGGFTLTTRQLPQAFQVLPVIVYRIYADGRPDELVRGVDIVGTPLAALTRIMTTGDQPHVFI